MMTMLPTMPMVFAEDDPVIRPSDASVAIGIVSPGQHGRDFKAFEQDDFQNLRDGNGTLCPLFRVIDRKRAEEENQDPFATHEKRMSRRRTPRSAPPIVDLLLELQRMMHYPDYPSRQHSLFANLGGYQTQYLKDDSGVFLTLPHKSSRVSISGITDFKVSDPESLCAFVRDALRNRFRDDQSIELMKLVEHKSNYSRGDYIFPHRLVELMELFCLWFGSEPEEIPELSFLLRFWRESCLVKDGICGVSCLGQEVVIQGPVRYVEVEL